MTRAPLFLARATDLGYLIPVKSTPAATRGRKAKGSIAVDSQLPIGGQLALLWKEADGIY